MAMESTRSKESDKDLIARLMAENEALKSQAHAKLLGQLKFRLNDQPTTDPKTKEESPAKFGVSLTGLGQFPITLYREQWLKVLDFLGVPADHASRTFFDSPAVVAGAAIATARREAAKAKA